MESSFLRYDASPILYAAHIDTTRRHATEGECITLLTKNYSENDSYEKVTIYDFLSPGEYLQSALLHSLVVDYSIDIVGINVAPSEKTGFAAFLYADAGNVIHSEEPFILQPSFSLFSSFLSIDFKEFIEAFIDLILLPFSKYTANDQSATLTRIKQYNPIANLFRLYERVEEFKDILKTVEFREKYPTLSSYDKLSDDQLKRHSDKLRDELHELRSKQIAIYTERWFNCILLQQYAFSYAKYPKIYGAPGRFAAFRQRYRIFDDRPYIAKMTADATTEKQYLYQTYIKQDLDKFDAALKLYVDRGPSLHCKTIVAEHLSVFFADMLDMIIDNQYAIKKCKLCGKYFVPIESNNIDYCLRPFKDKKTCRDIGPGIKAQEKIKNDDVRAELKRTYNRLRTRKERHPERPEFTQQFEQFNQEKKDLERAYKTGKLSNLEVLSALEKWKKE